MSTRPDVTWRLAQITASRMLGESVPLALPVRRKRGRLRRFVMLQVRESHEIKRQGLRV